MTTVFINGLNAKTGGGKSILSNLLCLLNKRCVADTRFVALTPCKSEYDKYSSDILTITDINSIWKKTLLFPFVNSWILPLIISRNKIDVIFNLADIVIPVPLPQVYLFDWPYAVYPESVVWEKMDFKSYFIRKIKLFEFKKHLRRATVVIAQTETMKTRLNSLYGIDNIEIIPNAVSLENLEDRQGKDFNLPEGKKLLYPTYYYPHKNIEIILPLAKEIMNKGYDCKIITTIAEEQHLGARNFLRDVKKLSLESVICNIGPVAMEHMADLYRQCDALFMPTLLESYGLPYVEAMFHKKTILTSDLDFARDLCGESAFYFNPLDEHSILSAIDRFFHSGEIISKIHAGEDKIKQLPNWSQVIEKYQSLIKSLTEVE